MFDSVVCGPPEITPLPLTALSPPACAAPRVPKDSTAIAVVVASNNNVPSSLVDGYLGPVVRHGRVDFQAAP